MLTEIWTRYSCDGYAPGAADFFEFIRAIVLNMSAGIVLVIAFIQGVVATKPDCKGAAFVDNYQCYRERECMVPGSYMFTGDECDPVTAQVFRAEAYARGIIHRSSADRYDVEHIVDLANSIEGCPKEIRGNMILADMSWNRAIGNACWKEAETAKRRAYKIGTISEIFYGPVVDRAIAAVLRCCGRGGQSMPPVLPWIVVAIVVAATAAVCVLAIVGVWWYRMSSRRFSAESWSDIGEVNSADPAYKPIDYTALTRAIGGPDSDFDLDDAVDDM